MESSLQQRVRPFIEPAIALFVFVFWMIMFRGEREPTRARAAFITPAEFPRLEPLPLNH